MSANINAVMADVAPLDPELQWLAVESASTHLRVSDEKGTRITLWTLARSFCPVVAKAIAERVDATAKAEQLGASEATNIGFDAMMRLDPDRKMGVHELVQLCARVVAASARQRA